MGYWGETSFTQFFKNKGSDCMRNNIDFNKISNLDELFEKWKQEHSEENDYQKTTVEKIEKNSFVADGYIYENQYRNSKTKILFVLKEANIADYLNKQNNADERNQYGFYRSYIEENNGLNNPKQQEKMARMAYCILNSSESQMNLSHSQIANSLGCCSFMNINKRGGANSTNNKVMNAYIEKYKCYIDKEIELLNPDVIIYVGKTMYKYSKSDRPTQIQMWHTAYPMPKQERFPDDLRYSSDQNVDLYIRHFAELL